jgi:hypothetical protein
MHTGPTKVMKWETRFSFVSGLIRVPYSSGRGQSCHLYLYDHSESKRKLDPLPIVSYCHPTLHKTHNVFHVFVLCHYVADESHKLNWKELQVSDVGTLTVEPLCILDHRV